MRSARRPAHALCALVALSLVTSACGLKPAQKDALRQGGPAAGAGTTGGAVAPGSGGLGGTAGGGTTGTALATTGGSTGGTTGGSFAGTSGGGSFGTSGTSGGTATGGSTTGGSTGVAAPAGGKCSTAGGDSTGITKSTIN